MVCSTAAKSSMKLIRSHSAATTLQFLCCTQLRKILPNCADALRVLPLPPGLRLLLSSQLGWVLTLGSADNSEDKATQTEDDNLDKYTNPSHNPSDTELVFISSSFSDNPGSYCSKDDPLDSASFLEASIYPDSASCPDDAHYQNSISIMDVTCYLDPSSPSAPTSDHISLPNPIYQHISASCACCDPPLSVSSEGRTVNDLSSVYKPEHTGSCVLGPSYTPTGHTSLWPDSASESDSDDFSSDLETYKRKRCRWT